MDWVNTILKLLKEFVPAILAYYAGRGSKEKEQLKEENEKLKDYKDIDDGEHSVNDAYNASLYD